ncbi:CpXC domain-containing protein, partial [Azospirillum canadense]|uniref:CpXC domain-containing protein n=1 Tax=Azospirillum canadense TaxID=403962 RepID=UPI0022278AB2
MTNNHIAPYDLSVSTPPFEQCPACGTEWAPALWIVVDADHRPDLLLAVQDHSLCTFRCGACANSISVNAPFLVVRGRTPRLMYSPSPGTTSLDDHNQLVSLLCRLKQAAAEHWDDKLAEELTIIARPLLPAELSNVAGRATHSATDLVNALLMADTTWKQQYMLARYPELYQADMWALLEKKIDEARQERNSSTLANLRAQYGLLTSCHRAGAAKIKSLLPSPRVYVSTTDLNDLLLESARAMLLRQSDAAVFSLLEATRRMKPAENPLLWAEIYLTLGELAEIDAAVDDDARLLAQ